MKITNDVVNDLIPLYVAGECSPDTRALIEEYLQSHAREAEELRRIMSANVPKPPLTTAGLDEITALREARRRLRYRSWLMGFAIFFSLAPFSFFATGQRTYWLLRDAPRTALVYGTLGVCCWIAYGIARHRSRSL